MNYVHTKNNTTFHKRSLAVCTARKFIVILFLMIFTAPVFATTPPIWVDPIANSHTPLFGTGQGTRNVDQALGFTFPYESGGTTNTITIGTHGGIALANGQTMATDIWTNVSFESNFSATGIPRSPDP